MSHPGRAGLASVISVPGGLCDLEMHRTLGLVLHDDGACRHGFAVADVPDLESDEVAAAKLAVDAQVEQGELAHPALHLETDAQRPDVLELERRLLPDELPLVPRLASLWRRSTATAALQSLTVQRKGNPDTFWRLARSR